MGLKYFYLVVFLKLLIFDSKLLLKVANILIIPIITWIKDIKKRDFLINNIKVCKGENFKDIKININAGKTKNIAYCNFVYFFC